MIVVYEGSVAVYNASNGDKLEERIVPSDKQLKFRQACVNYKGNEVYLATQNMSSGKNIVQSEVHEMMEIPPEDQIDFLLSTGRIKEAKDLFLIKENKGANFQARLKQFNVDAGWAYLM